MSGKRPLVRARLNAVAVWDLLNRGHMSKNELASRSGLATGYLSQLLNGKRNPSPATRRRLQEVLGRSSTSCSSWREEMGNRKSVLPQLVFGASLLPEDLRRRGWIGSRRLADSPGTEWRPASAWTRASCKGGGMTRHHAATPCLAYSDWAPGYRAACACCCRTTFPRRRRAVGSRDGFPISENKAKEESR